MSRVMVVGESWITNRTHYKGFDNFTDAMIETGIGPLRDALQNAGHEVVWMPAHEAQEGFPLEREGLSGVDVLVLSDIGANTLLLHPDTFLRGKPTANRLKMVQDWTYDGGALVMCGGYYSFQGINAGAFYYRTPIEEALPVSISPYDDRVETPEGVVADVRQPDHQILEGVEGEWPVLLGYNRVEAKPGASVLAEVGGDPLLVCGEYGGGRTLAWTSDIAPHWCPDPFTSWEGYGRIWDQAVRWLDA
ncbi:glutamine amidotransferase [Rubrobacter aplysinae]|uniref:glutamine amidotransferase n=1 Tax=Rubrobacter aplysinae TaxID=909625 RepID=UPI00064BCEE1|nr:glutamine amidotransferase [Rubrobacter aplysinae]